MSRDKDGYYIEELDCCSRCGCHNLRICTYPEQCYVYCNACNEEGPVSDNIKEAIKAWDIYSKELWAKRKAEKKQKEADRE